MYNKAKEVHTSILSANQYSFCVAVAQGENHVDAYERIYESSRETAAKNAARLLKLEKIQSKLEELRSADKLTTSAIRTELIASLLDDSRNEDLPARDRIAARAQLTKLCGLDQQKIEISAESNFLAAILHATNEPLVSEPSHQDPTQTKPRRGRPRKTLE